MVSWWKDESEVGFSRLWGSEGKQPGFCGQGKLGAMGVKGLRHPPRLGPSLHPPPLTGVGWTLVWQGWGGPPKECVWTAPSLLFQLWLQVAELRGIFCGGVGS